MSWHRDNIIVNIIFINLMNYEKNEICLNCTILHWMSLDIFIWFTSKPVMIFFLPMNITSVVVIKLPLLYFGYSYFCYPRATLCKGDVRTLQHFRPFIRQLSFSVWIWSSYVFIRPSSDGTYYGMVMSVRVSVRLSVRPSGSPSACFPHFSPTCFDILNWNFAHDFF